MVRCLSRWRCSLLTFSLLELLALLKLLALLALLLLLLAAVLMLLALLTRQNLKNQDLHHCCSALVVLRVLLALKMRVLYA